MPLLRFTSGYALIAVIAAFILSACSKPEPPVNPEPIIEMLPATEITRTEAVISARIEQRGTTGLSYLHFHYGETGNINQRSDATTDAETVSLHLQDLKPGTSYSCYAEGGTATATIRSQTIEFTTVPNKQPSVSPLVALSTGPISIIVEFEITDDGGEAITMAGCDIMNTATQQTTRTVLPPDSLTSGSHRMNITGLALTTSYIITPFAANSIGEATGEALQYTTRSSIILEEPGALPVLFAGYSHVPLEKLTITGDMNGDDFKFLRMLLGAPVMPGTSTVDSDVTDVDLTDAHIVAGGTTYDGSRFTIADEVSTGLFADCARLRTILLPADAHCLERDAFARCTALEKLTVTADITSVLPSECCTSLSAIEVSKANPNYASVDGVLFNHDVTEILWFPLGKTGTYTLPPTITAIGEEAFAGTNITSLVIPPTVTEISRGAFLGSSLSEISLPDNITNIYEAMFQNCTGLKTVHLGKATEYIGNYVFDGTDLTDLYVGASLPPYTTSGAFTNRTSSITENCTLHVPAGCKAAYRNHSKWGRFSRIEEF